MPGGAFRIFRYQLVYKFFFRGHIGATAVQVGTANYLDPGLSGQVAAGIRSYALKRGIERVADLVGSLEVPSRSPGG